MSKTSSELAAEFSKPMFGGLTWSEHEGSYRIRSMMGVSRDNDFDHPLPIKHHDECVEEYGKDFVEKLKPLVDLIDI